MNLRRSATRLTKTAENPTAVKLAAAKKTSLNWNRGYSGRSTLQSQRDVRVGTPPAKEAEAER
jgi:hypothetical protein